MPINIVALTNEINTDPASQGYAALKAAKNDQGIADKLNALTITGNNWISCAVLESALLENSAYIAIKDAADVSQKAMPSYNSARIIMAAIELKSGEFKTDNAALVAAWDNLRTNSVISSAVHDGVSALAVARPISRGQSLALWGAGSLSTGQMVTNINVANALGR